MENADVHSGLDGVLIDHSLWKGGNGWRRDREEEEGRVNGGRKGRVYGVIHGIYEGLKQERWPL